MNVTEILYSSSTGKMWIRELPWFETGHYLLNQDYCCNFKRNDSIETLMQAKQIAFLWYSYILAELAGLSSADILKKC